MRKRRAPRAPARRSGARSGREKVPAAESRKDPASSVDRCSDFASEENGPKDVVRSTTAREPRTGLSRRQGACPVLRTPSWVCPDGTRPRGMGGQGRACAPSPRPDAPRTPQTLSAHGRQPPDTRARGPCRGRCFFSVRCHVSCLETERLHGHRGPAAIGCLRPSGACGQEEDADSGTLALRLSPGVLRERGRELTSARQSRCRSEAEPSRRTRLAPGRPEAPLRTADVRVNTWATG